MGIANVEDYDSERDFVETFLHECAHALDTVYPEYKERFIKFLEKNAPEELSKFF